MGLGLAEGLCLNLSTPDPDNMRAAHRVLAQRVRHCRDQAALPCSAPACERALPSRNLSLLSRLAGGQSLSRPHSVCHERLQSLTLSPYKKHHAALQLA